VAKPGSQPKRNDEGVILVFWVLCLSLLATLLVGVIALGNLLQSSDNAQNAADAAALSAAGYLATNHPDPMIIHSLPITCFTTSGNFVSCKCHVDSSNGVTHCADYFWLEGYSLYKGDPWNEWEAIGSQISPKQALDYAAGSWTCSHQNGQGYCVKLNIHPPGNGYGVDAALTDDATISTAREATQVALGVQNNYGFSRSSGCTAPQDFLLAEGPTGITCISFDAAGTIRVSVPEPVLLFGAGSTTIYRTSWATTLTGNAATLCSGAPPAGDCR
jgi:hypothetical protein